MVLFFLLTIPFPVYPFATEFPRERDPTGFFTHLSEGYTVAFTHLFSSPNLSDCVVTLNLFSVFSHHCLSLSILFLCFISLGRSDFFSFAVHTPNIYQSLGSMFGPRLPRPSLSLRSTWPRSKDNHNKKPSQNNTTRNQQKKKNERKEEMRYYPRARRKSW
jgi:hypothetical protein